MALVTFESPFASVKGLLSKKDPYYIRCYRTADGERKYITVRRPQKRRPAHPTTIANRQQFAQVMRQIQTYTPNDWEEVQQEFEMCKGLYNSKKYTSARRFEIARVFQELKIKNYKL